MSIDADFAKNMFDHHRKALIMAARYLKEGRDERLLILAEETVEQQGEEMDQLATWLDRKGL